MTTMDIKYTPQRLSDNGSYQVYNLTCNFADVLWQGTGLSPSVQYQVGTPDMPAANIYSTFALAEAAFLSVYPTLIVTYYNTVFGTSNTLGNVVIIDKQIQDAINAGTGPTHTSNTVTRTVNGSATQCSASSRDNLVFISLTEAQSITLLAGQSGSIAFQTASTSGGSYTTFSQVSNANAGALTIGLNLTDTAGSMLIGFVPAGSYYKIISAGAGTNTVIATRELTL